MPSLKLTTKPLLLEDIERVAFGGTRSKGGRVTVALSPEIAKRIEESHAFLRAEIETDKTIYGVNTGFGLLSSVKIPHKDIEPLQYNLIRSHAVGTGDFLPDESVRAMLLLRAWNLAQGYSGVSLKLVEHIINVLNAGICPLIPEQGSVGASGDLAPLAHLALTLIGEGEARLDGVRMSSLQALRKSKLKPIRLGAKEGLALINGTQFMAALGTLALLQSERLCDWADAIAALSLEALRGTPVAFDEKIHRVRPHPGQIEVARRLRELLAPRGKKSGIAKSHEGCGKVQDPYSLRCIPQVHGASRDLLSFVRQTLEREVNAVTDNPLVFPKAKQVLSGGNFHGQIVAYAMDALSIAVAEIASISEQRIEKLVNPAISDLPAFLAPKGGLNSGFMIVQVAAASIVSENKTLCHPASVDSIPTSADKEDHVSMGAWAARKATRVVRNAARVLAMEWIAAAQGVDLLRPLKTTAPLEEIHRMLRRKVKPMMKDRFIHPDLVAAEDLLYRQRPPMFARRT